MELGTSILISSIFLGIVFLYISTKNRWNWKKLVKTISFILIAIVLIGVVYIVSYSINKIYMHQPHAITTCWDIDLNDTKEDIKFKKGLPDFKSDDVWIYNTDGWPNWINYTFIFNGNAVMVIMTNYWMQEEFQYLEKTFFPITDFITHISKDRLLKKLGTPSKIIKSEDGYTLTFYYDELNQIFVLKKNKISQYGIYNPDLLDVTKISSVLNSPFKKLEVILK